LWAYQSFNYSWSQWTPKWVQHTPSENERMNSEKSPTHAFQKWANEATIVIGMAKTSIAIWVSIENLVGLIFHQFKISKLALGFSTSIIKYRSIFYLFYTSLLEFRHYETYSWNDVKGYHSYFHLLWLRNILAIHHHVEHDMNSHQCYCSDHISC
jgi:hypothetical protein